MTVPSVEISTLAAYVDTETERWHEWFANASPAILELPLGSGTDGTIRTLIKHVFAVELRYAQRLLGEPVSEYEQLADRTVAELWTIHRSAAFSPTTSFAREREDGHPVTVWTLSDLYEGAQRLSDGPGAR